jgi:hypothetical protein
MMTGIASGGGVLGAHGRDLFGATSLEAGKSKAAAPSVIERI